MIQFIHTISARKVRYLLSGILVSLLAATQAQEIAGKYPFIHENLNHLSFSKDSSSFSDFYKKLKQLSEGERNRITIAHMGGSHVQGGIWSNVFLTDLQGEFKTDGGGYFIFPYRIAKTNGQPYATSFTNGHWKRCRAVGKEYCLPLGMSALSVNTNDSAAYFGIALTQRSVFKKFDVVKVYHNFNKSFEFTVAAKNALMIERIDNEKAGYSSFKLGSAIDSVSFDLLRKDTIQKDFIIYGFSVEKNQSAGFYFAGLGANGASSSSFLRCANLVPQLQSLNADLMILSLGVNDTQSKNFAKDDYIEHYDSLIAFAKKANPGVAIILTTTTDNYIKRRTSNKRTVQARDAMFELMEKHNLAVWDLFSVMGGYKSIYKWHRAGLASKDKVHFSPKGYTLIGNMMFDALIKSYRNNKKN